MGLCNCPDIFQEKMNNLFHGLDHIRKYIDDLMITRNKSLEDHIKKLVNILNKLKSASFKVNVK